MRRIQFGDMIAPGGVMRKYWWGLPCLVFLASGSVAAGLWLVVAHQNRIRFADDNQRTVVSAQREIATRLQARLRNFSAFAARWEQWGEPTSAEWRFDARLYENNYPECRSIVLTDRDARVRQSLEQSPGSDPTRTPGRVLFSHLTTSERSDLLTATNLGTPIVLPCREHGLDHPSLQVVLPLSHQRRFEGYFVACFDTNLEIQSVSQHLAPGCDLAVYAGNEEIFHRGERAPTRAQAEWMQEATAPYGGQILRTRLWPSASRADAVTSSYAPLAFAAGAGVSLLLAWLAALALANRRRADESTQTNRELQQQIAERLLAEEELQRITAETEVIFASIPSLLIGVDSDGVVTTWNATACRTFGIVSADALGEPLERCGVSWRWEQIAEAVSKCREIGETCSLEHVHFKRVDGSEGVLQLRITPIQFPGGGSHDGLLILGTDITEQQILETQLAQSQKLESIGQLAAGIAHEINTPIQYVGDNTRFLGDAFRDLKGMVDCYEQLLDIAETAGAPAARLEQAKKALADADAPYLMMEIPTAIAQSLEGVERVAHLVRAMKDFSHPGSTEKTPVDINRTIDSTVTVARNEWKYVAEMTLDLDPDLPLVSCLPGELNQVILNMVVNAAHAIGDVVGSNGDKGEIRIRTIRDGDWVEIRIADTGSGMSEEVKNRVFDPFFTTKEVGRGTGQGLSISRAVIIERHGGTINVETALGEGTAFSIRLPIGDSQNHQSEAA
ncbi:MAG: ATP-binding protein [Capsulimonas sp.]|uniref:two-component system sensor histidine kinase NtrB n=1 Tax=Capsulimonas sp. TaxID=2494211 RepID=UPI0032658493